MWNFLPFLCLGKALISGFLVFWGIFGNFSVFYGDFVWFCGVLVCFYAFGLCCVFIFVYKEIICYMVLVTLFLALGQGFGINFSINKRASSKWLVLALLFLYFLFIIMFLLRFVCYLAIIIDFTCAVTSVFAKALST